MKKQVNKEAGFTLVEMMIVIAALAVLAGAAVNGGRNWVTVHKSKQEVVELFTNIRKARRMAITENVNFVITFNVSRETYQIFRDNNGNGVFNSAVDVDMLGGIKTFNELKMVSTQIGLNGGSVAIFQPDGALINGLSGTVALISPQNKTYTINISGPTGRATM